MLKQFVAGIGLVAIILASARGVAQAPESVVIHAGTQATFAQMLDALAKADVVFVGENHDHVAGHKLELEVLRGVQQRRPRTALALEMFERDTQLVLDEYLAGLISESAFVAAGRPWPTYKTDYRPLVEFCRTARLPVVASNVPRRYVNAVSRGGQEALKGAGRDARRLLPSLPLDMTLPAGYESALDELFGGAHADGPTSPAMPTPEHMKQAQALWDTGMADSIVRFRRSHRGWSVIHMNGSMHSDSRWGIVDRLARTSPHLKVAVVKIVGDAAFPSTDPRKFDGVADYVVLTAPPAGSSR